MELEVLTTIKLEKYKSFKEKLEITKKYAGKAKIEIWDNYIYIERREINEKN